MSMAKRFAVMEFNLEEWQALAPGMKRLLGHAAVECALGGGIVRETNTRKLRCKRGCAVQSRKTTKRPDY